jgi:hypothetical protein
MFGHIPEQKKDMPVTIDVFLDYLTYDKFRTYVTRNSLDESSALVQVLERGMTNYWLMGFKQLKQSYSPMEKLFREYKRDNELLNALAQQNEEMKGILEKAKQKTSVQKPDHGVGR